MKIATRMLHGIAITIAMPTMRALPTSASAIPPAWPKSGRGLVKKSRLSSLRPLWSTVPSTSARMATATTALPTASPANTFSVIRRRRRPFERAVMSYRSSWGIAVISTPSAACSNLVTMTCAMTFVTSEMTIRIAPR